jgi:hypothetical protein
MPPRDSLHRQSMRALRDFRWRLDDAWQCIVNPGPAGRRYAVRNALCSLGLHHPITYWDAAGSYYGPPEYCWACERCGHERYPYRAILWRLPLVGRWVR